MPQTPGTPQGLSPRARALWRSLVTEDITWSEWELVMIREACKTLTVIDRAQTELDQSPEWTVQGVRGRQAHPLLGVVREHRALLSSLLGKLEIPSEDSGEDEGWTEPTSITGPHKMTRSESGTKAAQARWNRKEAR